MKVAFGTVVYPGALKFLSGFLDSLASQTYSDFDLIVVAEAVSDSDKQSWFDNFAGKITIVDVPANNPIHQNRVKLLEESYSRRYDLLILGDSDDTFALNRVEQIVGQFDPTFVAFYNQIETLGSEVVFSDLPKITSEVEILNSNYLGLSNTAINLTRLSPDFIESLNQGDTFCFDWYLYARVLHECGLGKLVEGASTYYRIHGTNAAGLPSSCDLEKELRVKTDHYRLLSKHDQRYLFYYDVCKSLLSGEGCATAELTYTDPKYWWGRLCINGGKIN